MTHKPYGSAQTRWKPRSMYEGFEPAGRRDHRLAVVCLGLLCFLLLTALIVLAVYYSTVTHHAGIEQNNLRKERDKLLLNYSLWIAERDQLLLNYSFQTAERDQLLLNYSLQTAERDQLLMKFDKCCNKSGVCPSGWRRLSTSCYYISTETKNWSDSRQACMQLEANLVIISSREEQVFVEGLSGDFWIGLSDIESEGTWKWVDGTTIPVEKGYWRANPQQPDNYGNEDCVHTYNTIHSVPFQTWNDRPCNDVIQWICESVLKC
nr:CD209 antigen-like protein C isoform X2 [Paramormyrops kingsleyae]